MLGTPLFQLTQAVEAVKQRVPLELGFVSGLTCGNRSYQGPLIELFEVRRQLYQFFDLFLYESNQWLDGFNKNCEHVRRRIVSCESSAMVDETLEQ